VPGRRVALVLVLLLAMAGCRRSATVAPLDLRELDRAYVYLAGETGAALAYQFPRDLGEVADLIAAYNAARPGGRPPAGPARLRVVFFRRTLSPVTFELREDGKVVVEHPERNGPQEVVSAALRQALVALEREVRALVGAPPSDTGPPAPGDAPRVVREYFYPEPPAPDLGLIVIEFDRPMDWPTVVEALAVSPRVAGVFSYQDKSLLFFTGGYPSASGQTSFTLTIGTGARAADGRPLAEEYRRSFRLDIPAAANAELAQAVKRTLGATTLIFERSAGAGAAWSWLPAGVPPPVGAGATVFSGRYLATGRAHYLRGDETTTLEGYRDGDRLWLRQEVAGELGPWTAYRATGLPATEDSASFLRELMEVERWGGLGELARSGVAVRLQGDVLGVRLPSLDARLGSVDEWEGALFVSYSVVVKLGRAAGGDGPVVEEIAYRLVYHRPDDPYPFSYFDDVSRFRVGTELEIPFPPELGR